MQTLIRINVNLIDNIYKTMLWSIADKVLINQAPQKSRKQILITSACALNKIYGHFFVCL